MLSANGGVLASVRASSICPEAGCSIGSTNVPASPSDAGLIRVLIRMITINTSIGDMYPSSLTSKLTTGSACPSASACWALVLATLLTNGAVNTIDRLIDVFPADQQPQVRTTLAEALAAVVSQQLLPTADGKGRVAAIEILLRTSGLGNIIREGNTPMLRSVIQAGKKEGMQALDDDLQELVSQNRITREAAQSKAFDKARFESAAVG